MANTNKQMTELESSINRFCTYFREWCEDVNNLENNRSEILKKLAFVSTIDALSKSVMPHRGNRDRFTSFVDKFAEWDDSDRVSISHLVQLLKLVPDPIYENVRKYALETYQGLSVHQSHLMPISIEPKVEVIQKIWPRDKGHKLPIAGVSLESITHLELFYSYRNSLVHEARLPGRGMEFGHEDPVPFYHQLSKITAEDELELESVELVYPSNFFYSICLTSIENLQNYLKENQINPKSSYDFGSYFVGALNK